MIFHTCPGTIIVIHKNHRSKEILVVRVKNILVDGLASQKFQIYIHTAAISPVYSHKFFSIWPVNWWSHFFLDYKMLGVLHWINTFNIMISDLFKCLKHATITIWTHTPNKDILYWFIHHPKELAMVYKDFLCHHIKKIYPVILLNLFFNCWLGCFDTLFVINYLKP